MSGASFSGTEWNSFSVPETVFSPKLIQLHTIFFEKHTLQAKIPNRTIFLLTIWWCYIGIILCTSGRNGGPFELRQVNTEFHDGRY
jgi:hypothetical protein